MKQTKQVCTVNLGKNEQDWARAESPMPYQYCGNPESDVAGVFY